MKHGGRLTVCALLAVSALLPATASAAYDASPTDGSGSATATGTDPIYGPYTATLTTSFTPSHIQPGQPFTYTARLQADAPDYSPCTPSSGSQTSQYASLGFFRLGPGEDFPTEGSTEQVIVAADFSNTVTTDYFCPGYRLTSGPMSVSVSGDQSQAMAPGCYQSSIDGAGLYFPHAPADSQLFGSLSGTLGTLRVGHGLDCAKPGAGVTPIADMIGFDSSGVGTIDLSCEQLASPCAGKAKIVVEKKHHHGRTLYPRCGSGCKVATGHYSVPPGSSGPIKLHLTHAGERLIGGSSGRILYPRCSFCKVGQLVLTSSANHAHSTTPIRLRGGCKHCG